MRSRRLLLGVVCTVAACGSTPEERGITGGGIGAASGAVVGAVTGLTVLEGALIGGAIGAAGGALTDKEDFYLGEPFWKRGSDSTQTSSASASSSLVANTQASLAKLGYDPGPRGLLSVTWTPGDIGNPA